MFFNFLHSLQLIFIFLWIQTIPFYFFVNASITFFTIFHNHYKYYNYILIFHEHMDYKYYNISQPLQILQYFTSITNITIFHNHYKYYNISHPLQILQFCFNFPCEHGLQKLHVYFTFPCSQFFSILGFFGILYL